MKKVLTFILVITLLLSFTACSKAEENKTTDNNTEDKTQTEATTDNEDVEETETNRLSDDELIAAFYEKTGISEEQLKGLSGFLKVVNDPEPPYGSVYWIFDKETFEYGKFDYELVDLLKSISSTGKIYDPYNELFLFDDKSAPERTLDKTADEITEEVNKSLLWIDQFGYFKGDEGVNLTLLPDSSFECEGIAISVSP